MTKTIPKKKKCKKAKWLSEKGVQIAEERREVKDMKGKNTPKGMQKQEIKRYLFGVTGKFDLGIQNKAELRLTEFVKRTQGS